MGRYPREVQSVASSMGQYCKDAMGLLDQRPSSPTVVEKEEIALLVEVAFSCLQTSPQSRPPMKESALGSRDQLQEASREQTLELDLPQAPGRLLDRALAGPARRLAGAGMQCSAGWGGRGWSAWLVVGSRTGASRAGTERRAGWGGGEQRR